MQKNKNDEVKPFYFENLTSDHVISQDTVRSFEFESLTQLVNDEVLKDKNINIRKERNFEKKSDFHVDHIVREHRGYYRQEEDDFEKKLSEEVEKRLEKIKKEAFDKGFEEGKSEGRKSVQEEIEEEFNSKIEYLKDLVSNINHQIENYVEENRLSLYEFVKKFTKWIILKEIDPPEYLEKLLEKLILELNSQRNLIIKVGQENFSAMPDIIKKTEEKLGALQNVRIEIVPEIHYPGIILESENGLIDGSLEFIFQNIDKIFEQVTSHE